MIRRIILLLLANIFILSHAQKGDPVVMVKGKVVNERNMQPLEALIIYDNIETGEEEGFARSNPSTGSYAIVLTEGKKYASYAVAEGYYSVSRKYEILNLKRYKEIDEQMLYLAPVAPLQVIQLNNIFFKGRTAELKEESFKELDRFFKFLEVNKKIYVEIGSHTDNKGEAEDDLELTKQRAEALKNYIVYKGINAERIKTVGYGQSIPMSMNKSKEGREMNNRIEFQIISLSKPKKK